MKIAVMAGDGIGPEIIAEALKVLKALGLKLEFEQDKFLSGEKSEVVLRIANFTGAPIRLGERPEWIRFSIEDVVGAGVARKSDHDEAGCEEAEQQGRSHPTPDAPGHRGIIAGRAARRESVCWSGSVRRERRQAWATRSSA